MAKTKINTIAQKSLGELKTMLGELRAELLKLKLDNAKRALKNTTSMSLTRKQIAKVMTAMHEKEGQK